MEKNGELDPELIKAASDEFSQSEIFDAADKKIRELDASNIEEPDERK